MDKVKVLWDQYKIKIYQLAVFFVAILYGAKTLRVIPHSDWQNAVSIFILSLVATQIYDKLCSTKLTTYFNKQEYMYHEIAKYLENKKVRDAIFLQYSCQRALPLIDQLANQGASITLFMQQPKCAMSQQQENRILHVKQSLITDIGKKHYNNLKIFYYNTISSFRGVLIDDKIIGVGWYYYEKKKPDHDTFQDDDINVWGHNIPGILAYRGSEEFYILCNLFNSIKENYEQYGDLIK